MEARLRRKIYIAAGVLAGIAIALTLAWRHTALAEVVTLDHTVDFLDHFSGRWWAPILIVLVYTPACMVMFPRPLLTIAAVMVFGPWKGFGLAMTGILVSAALLYFAGRRVDEATIRKMAGRNYDRLAKMLRKQGFMAVAAIGLLPVAPFAAEMVVAGALRIKLRDLLLGVAVANIPGVLGTTVLGDQVVAALHHGREVNRMLIVGVVLAMVTLAFISHRMWKRMEAAA
jgi:phospholipase D1/2